MPSFRLALVWCVAVIGTARAGVLGCGPWGATIASPAGLTSLSFREQVVLRSESPPLAILRSGGTGVAVLRDWSEDADGLGTRAALSAVESTLPSDVAVARRFSVSADCAHGFTVRERLSVDAATTIVRGLEVRVPLLRLPRAAGPVFAPLRDGRGILLDAGKSPCASYDLGGDNPFEDCLALAVPLVDIAIGDGRRLAVYTDPMYTSSFRLQADGDSWVLWLAWRHPGKIPFSAVEREVGYVLHGDLPHAALDAFMDRMAVARAPAWTDDIALVYFDYLSDRGQGWTRDLTTLADNIPPHYRHRVVVALHGWYDLIGSYSYDRPSDRFCERWLGQESRWGDAVPLDLDDIRRRLDFARGLGFRVLLYFADGLSFDSTSPMGRKLEPVLGRNSWNGPDVAAELLVGSPTDPLVRDFFAAYLRALLCELGDHVDGLVWDETFWPRRGTVAGTPPAHADVAMMTLTRELTAIVSTWNSELAFLTSDAAGLPGLDPPPNALMSHGTFQDSECDPAAWPYGFFPNWRKPLWSVLWATRTRFADMERGVTEFSAPVSLANGWADDWGPAEMSEAELRHAIDLARLGERPRRRPRP